MTWEEAKSEIQHLVPKGTSINTSASTHRMVLDLSEAGVLVQIGTRAKIRLPWSMLKTCFEALRGEGGYGGTFFRQAFPRQAKCHPCHVHAVGRLFVAARLAVQEGQKYVPCRG